MRHNKEELVQALMQWYHKYHRILPWRSEPSPYHVWVSEIMLQQTRVEAVKSYYLRFIGELPTINDLANCDDLYLHKLWEGLGYYNRVANMKKAAQICKEKYQGHLPSTYEELLALPGIGPYTAGAIASIAFHQQVAAVDGNVMRVFSRLVNIEADIAQEKTKKHFQALVQTYVPKESNIFNQAVMELGAMICIPNGAPRCNICPIQKDCIAYQAGTQLKLPIKNRKIQRKIEYKSVVLLIHNHKVHLTKRPAKGLLANLYQYDLLDEKTSKQKLHEKYQVPLQQIHVLPKAKHIFSHIEWHMQGYIVEVKNCNIDGIWADEKQIEEVYAIPGAFKVYTNEFFQWVQKTN